MSVRTASFRATYTTGILTGGPSLQDEDTFKVTIGESASAAKGIYSWDFSELNNTYNLIINEMKNASVVGVKVSFSYNEDSDGRGIRLMRYSGVNPEGATAANMLASITNDEVGSLEITTTNRTNVTIDLFDYNLFYEVHLDIAAKNHVSLAIERQNEFSTSDGSVEISGTTLLSSLGEWRAATGSEIISPPLLIVQYEIQEESHPRLLMKYTTSDPTTDQTTPENSVGGHPSPNDVFPSASIAESISSIQKTVPIDLDESLPSKTGLASVGPEIFKYTTIDTTRHQLTGITRGISPQSSFPAGFDSFRNPETVYYLATDDNNVARLFDTRPSKGLVQYRCVAIVNTDSANDFSIQDAFIGIVQDPSSNVQIHIGVEFPKHDALLGVSESGTTTLLLVDATYNEASGYTTGFFNGSYLFFPALGGALRRISSFDDGQFQFTPAVSGLGTGENFVIRPAPSQTISNDATTPTANSGRFSGFSETKEGIEIELIDHGNTMQEHDAFYVWIRRTLEGNTETTDDSGAILLFRFRST